MVIKSFHFNPITEKYKQCRFIVEKDCPFPEHFSKGETNENKEYKVISKRLTFEKINNILKDYGIFIVTDDPQKVFQYRSSEIIEIICKNEHKVSDRIKNFTNRIYCNECLEQSNSIIHQDFYKEWDSSINLENSLSVSSVSHSKYFWKCSEGHSYQQTPFQKFRQSWGCPYCSKKAILPGYNDFATTNPELSLEWSSKNIIKPSEITSGSKKKIWWICEKKHEWEARPADRRGIHSSGCPYCSKTEEEDEFFKILKGLYNGKILRNDRDILEGFEIDFLLPEINIGIEYNGDYWHSDKMLLKKNGIDSESYHKKKNDIAKSKGVNLLFIWRSDWKTPNMKALIIENLQKALTNRKFDERFFKVLSKG